ncbi:MAG: hypothetical protein FWD86_00150 [Firmicutes bacterium]|nr:hypothetical protein [Bacillota bacterium]
MLKKICTGVCCVMIAFMLVACDDSLRPNGSYIDHVLVYIRKEYNEKFDAREFSLGDFALDNARDFFYFFFPNHDDINYPDFDGERMISIRLIKTGRNHADAAVEYLGNLKFVERASLSYSSRFGNGVQEEFLNSTISQPTKQIG